MLALKIGLNRPKHLITVHARHDRISDHQVQLFLQGPLEVIGAIGRFEQETTLP